MTALCAHIESEDENRLTSRRNPPTLCGIGSASARPPSERKTHMQRCISALVRIGLTHHDLHPAVRRSDEAMEGKARLLRLSNGAHSRDEKRPPLARVCGREQASGYPSRQPIHGGGARHVIAAADQPSACSDARSRSRNRPEQHRTHVEGIDGVASPRSRQRPRFTFCQTQWRAA